MAGRTGRARAARAAPRRREPGDALRAPGEKAVRMIDTLTLDLGPHRHSARASGPDDGELVLLLHGFPETSYEWRAQLEALGAAGYRAVAPDQRGYAAGARPAALEEYAVDRLVDDVYGFADALAAERFH